MPNLRKLGPDCGLAIGLESVLNLIVKLQFGPFSSDNVNQQLVTLNAKPKKAGTRLGSDSWIGIIVKSSCLTSSLAPFIADNVNALVTNKPNLSITKNMRPGTSCQGIMTHCR